MKYQLRDISIFFKSSCCNKESDPENEKFSSCQIAPEKVRQYFEDLEGTDLKAATITIGNVKYGKLAYYEQHAEFEKAIKRLPKQARYYFRYEFQKNGQLHAHGIVYNLYDQPYFDIMSRFGTRNTKKESYQEIKHLKQYLDYMEKDMDKVTLSPTYRI
jgi:hypothetical protein